MVFDINFMIKTIKISLLAIFHCPYALLYVAFIARRESEIVVLIAQDEPESGLDIVAIKKCDDKNIVC